MNKYQIKQTKLRDKAIKWQTKLTTSKDTIYQSEVCEANKYFTKMGKKYGMLNEFKENCVI